MPLHRLVDSPCVAHRYPRLARILRNFAATAIIGGVSTFSPGAMSAAILLGSDYFETVQPTFFLPLDSLGLGVLNPLRGVAFGPGTTDTIVQRQANCTLDLTSVASTCTIPIEMVALALQSTVNAAVLLRESPTLHSTGSMTMNSDGTGTGGTFSSFFDIFVELSLDGGGTWSPIPSIPLTSSGTRWTTVTPPSPPNVLVPGLIGNQNANLHTNKNNLCTLPSGTCDFYLVGTISEQDGPLGLHSARGARTVAEPAPIALLAVALCLLAVLPGRWKR